jgi:hypothetical protein
MKNPSCQFTTVGRLIAWLRDIGSRCVREYNLLFWDPENPKNARQAGYGIIAFICLLVLYACKFG